MYILSVPKKRHLTNICEADGVFLWKTSTAALKRWHHIVVHLTKQILVKHSTSDQDSDTHVPIDNIEVSKTSRETLMCVLIWIL